MEFKVGDEVWVKEDLIEYQHYNGLYFVPSMKRFCGKKYKILDINRNNIAYYLSDGDDWEFNDAMLERIPNFAPMKRRYAIQLEKDIESLIAIVLDCLQKDIEISLSLGNMIKVHVKDFENMTFGSTEKHLN